MYLIYLVCLLVVKVLYLLSLFELFVSLALKNLKERLSVKLYSRIIYKGMWWFFFSINYFFVNFVLTVFFSFNGAHQLSLDFGYIKIWLASDSSNLSSEIQSHLLNLDVFRHLEGAVRLLMLQPRKKRHSPRDNDDTELESNISTMSSSSVLSSLSGVDIDSYDLEVLNDKSIPNSQKWLDLRLRGGKSKKGLLPFCLKVQEMK